MEKRRVDYDRIAERFDERYAHEDYSGTEEALVDFIGDGARALEVGCGTGHWLGFLAARGVRVTGLDASAGMLERARERLPDVILAHGTASVLPFDDASFDRVYAIHAFHHFDDKKAAIAEARRVLVPGGALMILGLDPHTGTDRWWIYEHFDGALERDRARYASAEATRAWLADAGFSGCHTLEAQHIPGRVPAREALSRGLCEKRTTSQLTIMTDREYAAGMARLERCIEDAEAKGEVFHLMADLRVYATIGRVG